MVHGHVEWMPSFRKLRLSVVQVEGCVSGRSRLSVVRCEGGGGGAAQAVSSALGGYFVVSP